MLKHLSNSLKKMCILLLPLLSFFPLSGHSASMSSQRMACMGFYSGHQAPSTVKIEGRQAWYLFEPAAIGDYVEPRYTPNGKTVELKEAAMTNQCRTSECYLFSAINFVNTHNLNVHKNPVVISEPYLVAHKFLQHIREGVWYGLEDNRVIHDLKGGFAYESIQLMRKVGLVARESWTPAVRYEDWDMKRTYAILETKVPEWHNYIRSLAQRYGSWDAAPVRQAERDAYEALKGTVLEMTGPLPETFTYKGSDYTPHQFEQIVGVPRQRILTIDNKEGNGLPSNVKDVLNEAMYNQGGQWKYQTGDYNTIINETVRFIEAGHPVIIDFHWKGDGHSMLAVGYEAQNGYVTRLKIMNSWGTDYGNDGYVWYTLDDVWNNVARVYKFGAIQ